MYQTNSSAALAEKMLIIAVRGVSKGKREAINQITFELQCGLKKIDAD